MDVVEFDSIAQGAKFAKSAFQPYPIIPPFAVFLTTLISNFRTEIISGSAQVCLSPQDLETWSCNTLASVHMFLDNSRAH
jgi:hypothetical protein